MEPVRCPFELADEILAAASSQARIILVDIHAEATSEKVALGWYLDGRVTGVIGTHTHIATADECILPQGTAYITDAGMCGSHDSVLGRDTEAVLRRFLTQMPQKLEVASGNVQLCGVIVEVDEDSGRAQRIERIRLPYEGVNKG